IPTPDTHSTNVSLLFYPLREHSLLHSFPTRRSSDLGGSSPSSGTGQGRTRATSFFGATVTYASSIARAIASQSRPLSRCTPTQRSEEHTSELQSRENLVCRLLLEKKKRCQGRLRCAP